MKLILDSCVPRQTFIALREAGLDVVWVGNWPKDPGDPAILKYAIAESRVLITGDKDFGELVVLQNLRNTSMIRLVKVPAANMASMVLLILKNYAFDLADGVILTAEPWRIRVKKL